VSRVSHFLSGSQRNALCAYTSSLGRRVRRDSLVCFADARRRWRWPSARDCSTARRNRGLQGSGSRSREAAGSARPAAARPATLMRSIHLDNGVIILVFGHRGKHQWPRSGRADHPQPGHSEPEFGPPPSRAQRPPAALERGVPLDPDHQGADEPSRPQCPQRAGRHDWR